MAPQPVPYFGTSIPGFSVTGTIAGKPFDGLVGRRWGRHFILVTDELRQAGAAPGSIVPVELRPA